MESNGGTLGGVEATRSDTPSRRGIDQMEQMIKGIKENPFGRRHIVSAWNPLDVEDMALPPCHMFFQCYVQKKSKCCERDHDMDGNCDRHPNGRNRLSLHMYQRSADLFLGVPF